MSDVTHAAAITGIRDFNDSLKAYVEQGVKEEYLELKSEKEKNPDLYKI